MPETSLLIVNYHTAELTRAAIQSARAAASVPLRVVVVDNSANDQEFNRLRDADVHELIQSDQNFGFARGVNLGMRKCSTEYVIVSNPDVVFRPRSLDLLIESIEGKIALSGPRFTWDHQDRWLLPPADDPTRWSKMSQVMATRSSVLSRRRDAQQARERLRFWSQQTPSLRKTLSGAVMALRRSVFDRLGGFDERFHLYFEEIDFMRRLRRADHQILYQPEAICRHLYNQSAAQRTDAGLLFLQSEREFLRKWTGGGFVRLAERIAGEQSSEISAFAVWDPLVPIPVPSPPTQYALEASPLPSFESAAGFFPTEDNVPFPQEIWTAFRGESLFLRVIRRSDASVAARYRLRKTVK
jgi:N-acetylglucosaminyl-diphospho-decaprenol L-rhamnosyltransferase